LRAIELHGAEYSSYLGLLLAAHFSWARHIKCLWQSKTVLSKCWAKPSANSISLRCIHYLEHASPV